MSLKAILFLGLCMAQVVVAQPEPTAPATVTPAQDAVSQDTEDANDEEDTSFMVPPPVNASDMRSGVNQITNSLGERDPFQRPKYIDDMEKDALDNATLDVTEDEKIEAIRRWPLKDYTVTAIMWDITTPKVMITDRKGTLHLLKKNYRIGNRNGIITAIHEGEIIVTENKIPIVKKIGTAPAR